MSNHIVFDEFHLNFRVPRDLDDAACDAIRRVLQSRTFRSALRRAARQIVRQYPDLHPVRIRISHRPNPSHPDGGNAGNRAASGPGTRQRLRAHFLSRIPNRKGDNQCRIL